MAEADGGNDLDKEDHTITKDDRTSGITVIYDRGNDLSGDERTPYKLPTTDHDDVAVSNVSEGCAMPGQSEWIQQHQQSDIRLNLKGDGPSLVGEHPTSIYNFGGHANVIDDRTSDTTTDRGAEMYMDVRTQTTIETPSHSDGPSNKDTKPETKSTSDRGYRSSRDGRAPYSTETFDHVEYSPRGDQTDDTIATNLHGDLAVSNVGEGGEMQFHNEVIQVQHRSNLCLTAKGDGPNLVGDNPTIVYNFNEDGSHVLETIEGSEERLTSHIEKLSKQMKDPVHGKEYVHESDQGRKVYQENQHWMMKQKEMMNDLCGMSAHQQRGMRQQQEMHTKCIDDMKKLQNKYKDHMKGRMSTTSKKENNLDLTEQRNLIGQTENWIQEQQQISQFVKTKAFEDAKEKIKEKRYVVIRGDSGAGKTRLAIELLDWLQSPAEKPVFNCKEPIRLPSLQSWDKVISANSNLSILLDDMLGYSSDVAKDLTWWKQHADMINPIVVGKESANYLIITLRNDIYHEYKSKFGYLSLFDAKNVIDLSSPDYMLEEEGKSLLRVYTPMINDFQPFSEKEINQIVDYSPPIGFPECCRIFKITPELHIKRVGFFMNPLQSIIQVIKEKFNTGKQTALLYLLLSRVPVSTKRLDFQNECFDKEGIAHVFRISAHVFPDSANNTDSIGMELQCLKQGLDVLCDSFFVRKEKGMYSFFHDSIRDTIAILYGNVTASGFLTNVPSSCLHYVATNGQSKDNHLCKVVIEEDLYDIAYQRILTELESKQHSSYMSVASMAPWNDEEFLAGFFHWFQSKGHLPEDYFIRWETGEPFIYANQNLITFFDVEMVKEGNNSSCFLIYAAKMNSVHLLRALVKILNIQKEANHMKHALDVAISAGNVECSTYLLQQNIEPDNKTCFCSARGGNVDLMKMLATSIKTLTVIQKWNIACEANAFDRYDICVYLLGLLPILLSQRDTNGNHLLHIIASDGSIACFKVVANIVMQGCQCDQERELFIKSLTDKDGNTVLHRAFLSANTEMLLYLMKEHPYLLTQKNSLGYQCIVLIIFYNIMGILTVKDVVSALKGINQNDMMASPIDGITDRWHHR